MPIYDYQCPKCETVEEHLASAGTLGFICGKCSTEDVLVMMSRVVSAPKIGGVAAQKIKDRAIRGGASVTPPVRVTVPNNYKKNNGNRGNRSN